MIEAGLPGSLFQWNICSERHYPPQKFGLNCEEKQAFSLAKGHIKLSQH